MPGRPTAAGLSNGHLGAGGKVGFIERVISQKSAFEGCLEYMLPYESTHYQSTICADI